MMKKLNFKNLLIQHLPYLFFAGFSFYWFLDNWIGAETVNFLAIGFILLMIFQLMRQKRILGFSLGIVLLVLSILIGLAMLSDFNNVSTTLVATQKVIIFGYIITISCFLMALQMMIVNYNDLATKSIK